MSVKCKNPECLSGAESSDRPEHNGLCLGCAQRDRYDRDMCESDYLYSLTQIRNGKIGNETQQKGVDDF